MATRRVRLGEAVHWFDFDRFWPELYRVLKKGGSAAFWVSTYIILTRNL